MGKKGDIITGLDIGSQKVSAFVGEVKKDQLEGEQEVLEIIGLGTAPSIGLTKGVVTDIESTVEAIHKAVMEAELMAGVNISSVYAGISGTHIRSFNSHGMTAVKGREINRDDIERVIEQAKAVAIPVDREVLHCIVQEYLVDDQGGIRAPVGMNGIRLEAKVHLVTCNISAAQNVIKCCQRVGLNVAELVLAPLSSALSVLTPDERNLGCVLVDIGGGTADIIIFYKGAVAHTSVLGIGGHYITGDIAMGLRTPTHDAEEIKKKYGSVMSTNVDKDEMIEVPRVGGGPSKSMSRQLLCEIIEARAEEMFSLIGQQIQATGFQELLGAGMIITGGITKMEGMTKFAEQIVGMPVRKGEPQGVEGLDGLVTDPAAGTGVGLVQYGSGHIDSLHPREGRWYSRVRDRIRHVWENYV